MSQYPLKRRGGRYADLTFQGPAGTMIHILTGELDAEGNPVRRDVAAAESIRRLDPTAYVGLIPNLRPGMDEEALISIVKEKLTEMMTEILGPPPE